MSSYYTDNRKAEKSTTKFSCFIIIFLVLDAFINSYQAGNGQKEKGWGELENVLTQHTTLCGGGEILRFTLLNSFCVKQLGFFLFNIL